MIFPNSMKNEWESGHRKQCQVAHPGGAPLAAWKMNMQAPIPLPVYKDGSILSS